MAMANGDNKRLADANGIDPKKPRYENTPSKVLHVRPIPRHASQQDIVNLFAPFSMGGPVKVFISQGQGQAFVELPHVTMATAALQSMAQTGVALFGVPLQVEYSQRSEVSVQEDAPPGRVVLATVSNMMYPVDLELLHSLFVKYGNIFRMATFNRTVKKDGKDQQTLQCLIEFEKEPEATAAMQALNGRCIYAGCNELEVQYSKMQQLTVKSNNEKFRDFTNPSLPTDGAAKTTDGRAPLAGTTPLLGTSGLQAANGQAALGPLQMSIANPFAQMDSVALASLAPQQLLTIAEQHRQQVLLAQTAGKQVVTPHLVNQTGLAGHPMNVQNGLAATPAGPLGITSMHGVQYPKELMDAGFEHSNRDNTPVVMVHNLPTLNVDPRKLFNLFSIYGNVTRVKILYNKADTAMIQFSDPFYATMAAFYLSGANVGGSEILVQFSKNKNVSGGGSSDELAAAKNLSANADDQRYGDNSDTASRFVRNACRPTSVLFVTNFGEEMGEENLSALFGQFANVKRVTMIAGKEGSKLRMANVAVGSPLEAVASVMNLHGLRLGERELKVAFSRVKNFDDQHVY
uniref:RRM domain-containing protein n=1 Tax=Chromera velia CCMP2878 TaxID=1169474 RepID=A0A0G4FK73_9ALVE|eukprot:Cvel_17386.t1-p1 / transcript=Cvel_17386.t1 / gene=Cvel_17386 / organism=Chromera_velia_CCMP2878 / gene_product=Polypyrimidine tract-binding protein 1, putative / transcript_product=Polypyrimidine tract-binding protein 1, putative / location=Cvel_scaffold1383:34401-40763(-) / protein_length=573 / sequence_SO=supercontig / SO=protein_coding / is_pseudo=false